jgi:hypothetical protein
MILPFLALLLSQTAAATPSQDEIIVTAQKLRRIRVDTKTDRKSGEQRCRIRRSSGDPGLDAAFCNVVLTCARTEISAKGMSACVSTRVAGLSSHKVQGSEPRSR